MIQSSVVEANNRDLQLPSRRSLIQSVLPFLPYTTMSMSNAVSGRAMGVLKSTNETIRRLLVTMKSRITGSSIMFTKNYILPRLYSPPSRLPWPRLPQAVPLLNADADDDDDDDVVGVGRNAVPCPFTVTRFAPDTPSNMRVTNSGVLRILTPPPCSGQ